MIEQQKSSAYWQGLVRSNPALIRLTTPRLTPYIPYPPEPKQAAFLLLDCREALYGGAAGGGKSFALLMAALQYVDVPGYAALILRRTYKDLSLPGALMDVAAEWLAPTDAHWNDQEKTWWFPSGASLTFGYLQTEKDKYQYQGAGFQFIAFDELSQFTRTQYTYLFSRLRRRVGLPVPVRMRAGSNPGGAGHEWVKQRFFVEGQAKGRKFIPAKLDDNPHLDREAYIESLGELDSVTRTRLLEGNWDISEGGSKFRREWFTIVPTAPSGLRQVRYWDLAGTEPSAAYPDPDWTAGLKLGKSAAGVYYIQDVRRVRRTPGQVEQLIRQTAELDGRDVPIVIEQEGGASGKAVIEHYRRRVLDGWRVSGRHPTGDKVTRAMRVSARAEAGDICLVQGAWISPFLDELEMFPEGAHDDQVDTLEGAYDALTSQGVGFA